MNIDYQILFNAAVGLIGLGAGFMLQRVFSALDRLRASDDELTDEINRIKIALPTNYVTKPDMEKIANTIFNKLDRLQADINKHYDRYPVEKK